MKSIFKRQRRALSVKQNPTRGRSRVGTGHIALRKGRLFMGRLRRRVSLGLGQACASCVVIRATGITNVRSV
ncbi:hypothetical protein DPMN_049243 [Dreissena polymorpha]|uniref:Uncharacterized protein n=1 Tax=Dreissena polymorpha TaxID=45954 RepID=A0A9D4CFJ4_DREPO|nr:hypothetical protein DPMN_049243 [Dreissena polymorpha]